MSEVEIKTVHIQLTVTEAMAKQLKAMAESQERTVSALCRRYVRKGLEVEHEQSSFQQGHQATRV